MPSWKKSRATAGPARTARPDDNDNQPQPVGYALSSQFDRVMFIFRQHDMDCVETVEELLAKSPEPPTIDRAPRQRTVGQQLCKGDRAELAAERAASRPAHPHHGLPEFPLGRRGGKLQHLKPLSDGVEHGRPKRGDKKLRRHDADWCMLAATRAFNAKSWFHDPGVSRCTFQLGCGLALVWCSP